MDLNNEGGISLNIVQTAALGKAISINGSSLEAVLIGSGILMIK